MKLFTILTIAVLFCGSCQKEKKNEIKNEVNAEKQSAISPSEKLSNRIENAYNIKTFQTKNSLKYTAELTISDTLYFKGTFTYAIPTGVLNVKAEEQELSIAPDAERSQREEFLYHLNEIYILPFVLNKEVFKLIERTDSIVTSGFDSKSSKLSYTLTTHPLTEIIQSLKIDNAASVFDSATIRFDKYITVNRIPVSMHWKLYKRESPFAEVKISRISYD